MSKRKSTQSFEEEEEPEKTARPPDRVVRERLIDDVDDDGPEPFLDDFETELESALLNSVKEFEEQERLLEERIRLDYEQELVRRSDMFVDFLNAMKRILPYDRAVSDVFHLVKPIIDRFIEQSIELYEVNDETYDYIFETVRTIRLKNPDSLPNLQQLIRRKDM